MGCQKFIYKPELHIYSSKKMKRRNGMYIYNYRYGFNGKEKMDEISGDGNSVDFGARILDTRLGRWMSLDPLQDKYPALSAYNYVANNPIKFIDPDGKEIRIAGSKEYQAKALKAMQELTNDKLVLKNGVVYISKLNSENKDKKLSKGSDLIRELNNKDQDAKVVTIYSPEAWKEAGLPIYNNKLTSATQSCGMSEPGVDPNAEKYKSNISSDGTPGKKDDVNIRLNLDDITTTTLEDGKTKEITENKIELAHELIHAKDFVQGTRPATELDKNGVEKNTKNKAGEKVNNAEIKTRNGENEIRQEQGIEKRYNGK